MEKGHLQASDFSKIPILSDRFEPLKPLSWQKRARAGRVEIPDSIRPLVTPFRVRENAKID
jgi:hypothetical protein